MINIFKNLFSKKESEQSKPTNYKAGYLNLQIDNTSKKIHFGAPSNFVAPKKIDNRDMALQSNQQGNLPYCAGYAICGFCEIYNWRIKHYPEQLDAIACYEKAKQLEGNNNNYDGTTLEFAADAAIQLNYIEGKKQIVTKSKNSVKFAIHQYNSCIGGFLIDSSWNQCDTKTGRIPKLQNPQTLGGHAVLICGYDEEGVYIQNSWSIEWGLYGFCLLSWDLFDQQFVYGIIIS